MGEKEGKTLVDENIIEFNGKRYDAVTGKLLGKGRTPVAEGLPPQPIRARSIEGVVRPHKAMPHAMPATPKSAVHKAVRRQPANHARPHRPESAKTLMRRAVHKPKPTPKPAIKPQVPAEIMAKQPGHIIAAKQSVHQINPVRKIRATHTPQSDAVRRFAPHRAEAKQSVHPPVRPRVSHAAAIAPSPARTPAPRAHTKTDMFEAVIARANSHEQPRHPAPPKHRRGHRAAGILAGIAAFLVMGGFLAYLNLPRIELKIASINAGFGAHMPSYSPTGYELADIDNRPGKVTLSFRSGDRSYRLTQQPSNWTSQTLQDDIIASAGSKTIESKGRIIYLYDGMASWLSGEVRYDLTGNAPLDEQEIAEIAAST